VGRALAIIGVIAILGGGAAIGYSVTRKATTGMTPAQTAAMTHAVDQLESAIQTTSGEIHVGAGSVAGYWTVQVGCLTDQGTVDDDVRTGELALKPVGGQIIAFGRVVNATKQAEVLFVRPTSVTPAAAVQASHDGKPGHYAQLVDGQLMLTEVVHIEPPTKNPQGVDVTAQYADQAAKFAGFVIVSQELKLDTAVKSLIDAGITGKIVVDKNELPVGTMPAGATTHEQPLRSMADIKIVAADAPPHAVLPLPILIAGIAAAVIGLLLLVIGMMGKREDPAAYSRAFNQMPTMPTTPPRTTGASGAIGNAETQLSSPGVTAAGTPSTMGPGASSSQIVPQNLGPGAMIGRWEVVRRLGSGGMADVYLAQAKGDGGFEKLVAIKVMHAHLARTQRAVDHFLDEARLAARIQHPNVVQIQDLGKIGTDYVIVMEYVEGVDLERLLMSARQGERPVPLAVGLGILCRICDGLDAAHNATAPDGSPLAIVHRDVKSANVLVSRQGSVKVVDFGIAKAATQVHQTVAGETKGTPSMMAPEQRVGEQVDVRADVYSVAAVGYEIVTGHGVNLDLAALAHLGIDNWPHLPLPSSLRAQSPVELDEILLHAMAFERDRRPANCATFEASIQAVMKAHGLTATDKDIARWIDSELRYLSPAHGGLPSSVIKSPTV
jgi:serine/threonine-protein kinase